MTFPNARRLHTFMGGYSLWRLVLPDGRELLQVLGHHEGQIASRPADCTTVEALLWAQNEITRWRAAR